MKPRGFALVCLYLTKLLSFWHYLTIHTILWRCKLKPPLNDKLKNSIIDLFRNIIRRLHDPYLPNLGVLKTNTVNVRGKNTIMRMNHSVLINIRVNSCALKREFMHL